MFAPFRGLPGNSRGGQAKSARRSPASADLPAVISGYFRGSNPSPIIFTIPSHPLRYPFPSTTDPLRYLATPCRASLRCRPCHPLPPPLPPLAARPWPPSPRGPADSVRCHRARSGGPALPRGCTESPPGPLRRATPGLPPFGLRPLGVAGLAATHTPRARAGPRYARPTRPARFPRAVLASREGENRRFWAKSLVHGPRGGTFGPLKALAARPGRP